MIDFCAYTPEHIATLLAHLPGQIRQYVFISTTSVCRPGGAVALTEDAPKLDGPQRELGEYASYGYDKWRAELVAAQLCAERDIALTILRPAIIYGYYNYAPRETCFFEALCAKRPIVLPEEEAAARYSFIWVVDMARLIMRCLDSELAHNESFNLASPELVSFERIVAALAEITGKPVATERVAAAERERRCIVLPFPPDADLLYSGAKIDRLYAIEYTSLASGLRQALRYYLMLRRRQAASP